jgi:hypothetical protein
MSSRDIRVREPAGGDEPSGRHAGLARKASGSGSGPAECSH